MADQDSNAPKGRSMLGTIKKLWKTPRKPWKYLNEAVSELEDTISRHTTRLEELDKEIICQDKVVKEFEKNQQNERATKERQYHVKLTTLQHSVDADRERLRDMKINLLKAEWTLDTYHGIYHSTQAINETLPTMKQVEDMLTEGKYSEDLMSKIHALLVKTDVPAFGSSPTTTVPASLPASRSGLMTESHSFIGERLYMKLSCDAETKEFIITDYNAEQKKHQIAYVDSNQTRLEELSSWIDLREADVKWKEINAADFDALNN